MGQRRIFSNKLILSIIATVVALVVLGTYVCSTPATAAASAPPLSRVTDGPSDNSVVSLRRWEVTSDRISSILAYRYSSYMLLLGRVDHLRSVDLRERWASLQRDRKRLRTCRTRVAMCIPTKNDDLYLQEWAAYHLQLGVTHIYLYDDNSTTNPTEVLQPFVELKFVTIIRRSRGSQSGVYQQCLSAFKHLYDWVYAGDSDEYIMPEDTEQCFGNFLEEHFPTKIAVQLQWATYYTSGHNLFDASALVVERFTERARWVRGSKAVYRASRVIPEHVGIHSIGVVGTEADESIPVDIEGKVMPKMKKGGPYGFFETHKADYVHTLYLNHYWSKSFEEYALKRARGRYNKSKNSYELQSLVGLEAEPLVNDTRINRYLGDLRYLLGKSDSPEME